MRKAFNDDVSANAAGKPALQKLQLVKEVVLHLSNVSLQRQLIDKKILHIIKDWLTPLPDGSLVSEGTRTALYKVLAQLPLLEDDVKESGIGRVVLAHQRHPNETDANKKLLTELIQKWSRLVMKASTDFTQLAHHQEADVQAVLLRKQQLDRAAQASMQAFNAGSKRPKYVAPQAFDYAIRPGTSEAMERVGDDEAIDVDARRSSSSSGGGNKRIDNPVAKKLAEIARANKASRTFVKPSVTHNNNF